MIGIIIMLTGALLTSPVSLWVKLIGITIFTFGFFGAHSIASGWVSKRAVRDKAQASSLYLFAYYFGSSVGGTTGGFFWLNYGWNGIVVFITILLVLALLLAISFTIISKKENARMQI